MKKVDGSGVGAHCFAGGITAGFAQVFDVAGQLEVHELGCDSVRHNLGIPVIKDEAAGWITKPPMWAKQAQVIFGNPRCTAFSCLNHGCGKDGFGPEGKATADVRQMVDLIENVRPTVFVWESVQPAITTGLPLALDIEERLAKLRYHPTRMLLNAATWGNSQNRRRFFHVFTKPGVTFWPDVPDIPERWFTVREAIEDLAEHPVTSKHQWCYDSLEDAEHDEVLNHHWWDDPCFTELVCSIIPPGRSMNDVPFSDIERIQAEGFDGYMDGYLRGAGSFSRHAARRLHADGASRVVYGGWSMVVHPWLDRGVTVRETARIMGFPDDWVFLGPASGYCQIGKGVVPAVAEWLAWQIRKALDNPMTEKRHREMRFNVRTREVEEHRVADGEVRTFDFTRMCAKVPRPKLAPRNSVFDGN